jgi:hypothetical protein
MTFCMVKDESRVRVTDIVKSNVPVEVRIQRTDYDSISVDLIDEYSD